VSKRLTCIGLLLAFAFTIKAQQNLVLNGSFELNSVASCSNSFSDNLIYSNYVSYSESFGVEHSSGLYHLPCWVCSPSLLWGGQPQDGNWVLGLDGRHEILVVPPPLDTTVHNIKQGKVSLELATPLLDNKRYKLSFYAKSPPTDIPTSFCITKKGNFVEVGISNIDTVFGILLLTTSLADTSWLEYTYVFETQNGEQYITIQAGLNDTINQSILLDNFVLTETEEPLTTGVNEVAQHEKQLLKIVDVLGRESKPNSNTPLFYIYSDGTVEKKLIIE
jgi:hypothetical protein